MSLHPGPADAGPLAGSQGTDTALAPTDSAVTVPGRACPADMAPDNDPGCGFQNLKITVNQTKNLTNQAISVTWTGGRRPVKANREPAEAFDGVFGNFLQIFQCWGDDDGTNKANPGPPPEKCQFGGFQSTAKDPNLRLEGSYPYTRIVTDAAEGNYDGGDGVKSDDDVLWKPFHAVDGTVVGQSADFDALNQGAAGTGSFWLNPYFNAFTTNENPVARSNQGGTGSELFTVATGLEASGLGCGQRLEPLADRTKRVPKCWLVVVPRSTGAAENPDPAFPSDQFAVRYSPLAANSWRNRIAVPLDFKPLDSPCTIGADERRLAGSELAGPAVGSWQPTLCATPGSPPYSYSPLSDDRARQQVATAAPGAPGMAVVSNPIDSSGLDPEKPALYAPISLSGVTIGFNIERVAARTLQDGGSVAKDPDEVPLEGIRVGRLNLTPRLVGKLLAQSYKDQFGGSQFKPTYEWYRGNPKHLLVDPDFLQFNPEFANLAQGSEGGPGRLVLALPSSDAAQEVWRWVLADPEAAAWLAGTKDQWGMQVNPVYSTNPARNPSGTAFGDPIPMSYPKSDPFCHEDPAVLQSAQGQNPRPLCLNEIAPYVSSMQEAALATRTANDRALTDLNFAALTPDTAWRPTAPQPPGRRVMLSITDTASAVRYGLQTANLSRAGDNAPGRSFIAPDVAGLLAGQRAMVKSSVPGVLKPDPATKLAGAYPLSMLTYGAALPANLDAASRKDFAAFLDYAAGPGQLPGLGLGQLPPGYAPLPPDLRAQTTKAAAALRASAAPAPSSGTTTGGQTGGPTGPGSSPSISGPGGAEAAVAPESIPAAGLVTGPLGLAPLPPGAPPVVTTIPTPKELAGFVRFVVPIAVGLCLLAGLGVMIVDDRWLRALASKARRSPAQGLAVGSG